MIYDSIEQLIGKTPLLHIKGYEKFCNAKGNLFAKLEYFNPAGSSKDRAAKKMLDDAFEKGLINDQTVIIEPTSGNTGIALAAICSSRGMKTILTMPESMSVERRKLLSAYGAEIILTDASQGMQGAVQKAEELAKEIPNSYICGQFDNISNPDAHYKTTGPEIFNDCEGKIDYFVAGIGTGGTITGVARYLKEKNPDIKIIGVEPASSPLISKGISNFHKIQGIGANFIPNCLDMSLVDEIVCVKDDDAINAMKQVAITDGILVGISSGAAIFAAAVLASDEANHGKNIIAFLPDTGARYLSAL